MVERFSIDKLIDNNVVNEYVDEKMEELNDIDTMTIDQLVEKQVDERYFTNTVASDYQKQEEDVLTDYYLMRDISYSQIKIQMDKIKELDALARETKSSKYYSILSNAQNTLSILKKDLADIHLKIQRYKEKRNPSDILEVDKPKSENTNFFYGSTNDLLFREEISEMEEEIGEGDD